MTYAKTQVLSLYRSLLRNSSKFDNYNFREYFLRKTKSDFRKHKSVSDNTSLIELAYNDLALLKRQAIISQMYHADRLVVEKATK